MTRREPKRPVSDPASSPNAGAPRKASGDEHLPGYPLPKEVAKAVRTNRPSNLGLLFHRLLHYPKEWRMEGKDKADVWNDQVIHGAQRIFQDQRMQDVLTSLQLRMDAIEAVFKRQGLAVLDPPLRMTVDWRLAIGFSATSILETGIALHRIYGIPYLPGSALKGLARHFRLATIADELGIPALDPERIQSRRQAKNSEQRQTPWEMLEELLIAEKADATSRKDLEKRLQCLQKDADIQKKPDGVGAITVDSFLTRYATTFRRAFGNMTRKGELIFIDALPETLVLPQDGRDSSIMKLDIINTHYQTYYTGNPPSPPADYLSPIPVYFLTVQAGAPFRFRLAAKDQKLLNIVRGWLQEALQQFGVGAKTMAGYGAMR